jgi:two-component system KDP operon response regulator KdpE
MSKPARAKAHDRILIVAAEPQIQRLLKSIFRANGYQVFIAADVAAAIETRTVLSPELVVLDLDLPGLSGRDAILEIRRWSDVPMIVLSNQHREADLVAALDLGADDYLEKPFRAGELLARIRCVLRRSLMAHGEAAIYHCGPLDINILDHSVTRGGEPVRLTPTEFEILSLLVRNSGRVVSYQRFFESPSEKHYCKSRQALRAIIWALRQKCEDDPHHPRIVLTEEGFGYRLVKNSASAAARQEAE